MTAAAVATEVQPVRIQRRRVKGWRVESPNGLPVVYVGRPSKWGNPFSIKEFGNLGAVWKYEGWLENTLNGMRVRDRARKELRGKNLMCFCPIGSCEGLATCHADVLLKLANE